MPLKVKAVRKEAVLTDGVYLSGHTEKCRSHFVGLQPSAPAQRGVRVYMNMRCGTCQL